MERGWIGLAALLAVAWACSEKRREVDWKRCAVGVGLQVALALICVRVPLVQRFFLSINSVVEALGEATRAGTSFIFGYLGGGPLPFDTSNPGQTFILAFQALPLVLVVSALSSLLGVWQGVSLMFSDFVHQLQGAQERPEEAERSRPFRFYLLWLTFPPMLLLLFDKPFFLVILYSAFGAFFMPFLAITLILLLNRRDIAAEHRNGWMTNGLLGASAALFIALCGQQLWALAA